MVLFRNWIWCWFGSAERNIFWIWNSCWYSSHAGKRYLLFTHGRKIRFVPNGCPKLSLNFFSAEHAMVGATGKPFGSHKIKVEYGSLSKKPIYDKHSRKVRYPSHQSKSKSVFNLISRLFFTLRIFLMHPWTILIYFEKNSIYLALLRMLKLSKANI